MAGGAFIQKEIEETKQMFDVKVMKHVDGRTVVVRYEEGHYRVVVVDEHGYENLLPHTLWPRSRAIRFAKSIARDEFV
jgi:hypothetical protein